MEPQAYLQRTFLDNTLENYLWAAGILLAGWVFKRIFSKLISKVAYSFFKKYSRGVRVETFLALLTRPVSLFVMLIVLYLAFDRLQFPATWNLESGEKFGLRMVLTKLYQASVILSVT